MLPLGSDSANEVPPRMRRRKVRKGTHSCWECKRRKMKCVFNSRSKTKCEGCWKRRSSCISQEFSDTTSPSSNHVDGIEHVDDTADDVHTNDGVSAAARSPNRRPQPTWPEFAQCLTPYDSFEDSYGELSRFLHGYLPSREDTERLCNINSRHGLLTHEMLTKPYKQLDQNGIKASNHLLEIPGPNFHPVLISRHMLHLAVFLQYLRPDAHVKAVEFLSESPRALMERLASLATRLTITDDAILGSIESLECVMIEAMYHANMGSLRRSWVANRRAMSFAQLMGLDRSLGNARFNVIDHETTYEPQVMWFRIVYLDRYLCLLLGLPQGSSDRSMASKAMLEQDTPMGRLERVHCVVASRILERYERNLDSEREATMRAVNDDLLDAARALPSRWWLAPDLSGVTTNPRPFFWHMRRLFAQLVYYNLLVQAHLPFMFRSPSVEGRSSEYSRITCINASREILWRSIALRNLNQTTYCCRTVDFLAVLAAMTLLLAHLSSASEDDGLDHQYLGDRAMIEKTEEHMRELNRLNKDALCSDSLGLLRRLLDIESQNKDRNIEVRVREPNRDTEVLDQGDGSSVSVHIPYLGIVNIVHHTDGPPHSASNDQLGEEALPEQWDTGSGLSNDPEFGTGVYMGATPNFSMPSSANVVADVGNEEWTFPDIDMAFFENLPGISVMNSPHRVEGATGTLA